MNYLLGILIILALAAGVTFVVKDEDVPKFEEQDTVRTEDVRDTTKEETEDSGTAVVPEKEVEGSVLDMSNEGLTKVPNSVFEKRDLIILNLSHNKLTGALQAEVRHLQNLRELDLSDNAFTGVPAEIGQLSKLEVLDLSNNPLTGLPNELGNLQSLKVLDLRGTSYAVQDLEGIRKGLPLTTVIKIDWNH